jgi:hypothetical protein
MYDTPLTVGEVIVRLDEQLATISSLTANVPAARLQRPPSDHEWSVNDVLAHLRSCADVWGKYMAMIVTEDHPTIRAVNPRTWVESTDYPKLEFAPSFRAFAKQRKGLVSFLESLPEAAWSRSATVTGAGRPRERTVLEYGRWLANHERTHVKQIARLVEQVRSLR